MVYLSALQRAELVIPIALGIISGIIDSYDDSYEQPCEHPGKLVKLQYVIDDLYEKAYETAVNSVRQLLADKRLSFGTGFHRNNFYFMVSDTPHNDVYIRFYFYNAFRAGLFRD